MKKEEEKLRKSVPESQNLHLANVVRTNARARIALFFSCSPLMRNTFSFSQGDRISKYRFSRFVSFTLSGKRYQK